ncbi:MAG: hypothetical protein IPL95_16465 [Saprospiraceae bacterium]|nr:hypothetical protein [Saprospiraceae bacterium]
MDNNFAIDLRHQKIFHLPALLFILIFGLFVGNIDELRHIKFIQQFHPDNFTKEVVKFRGNYN